MYVCTRVDFPILVFPGEIMKSLTMGRDEGLSTVNVQLNHRFLHEFRVFMKMSTYKWLGKEMINYFHLPPPPLHGVLVVIINI